MTISRDKCGADTPVREKLRSDNNVSRKGTAL
jgi:hypothetical protein